jgi:hypothetical protein
VRVTGGVTGLEVRADDLDLAARALSGAGRDLLAAAAGAVRAVDGAQLAVAAVVDPAGAARVAAALTTALAGPSGLGATALAVEVRAGRLVLAAARYRSADAVALSLDDARRWVQGAVGVAALPAAAVGLGSWWAVRAGSGSDPAAEAAEFLRTHPGVVDEVVGSAPGALASVVAVLGGVPGPRTPPRSLQESAGLLALLYPPARVGAEVVGRGPARPPDGLGALVGDLAAADRAARGDRQGELVVVRQTAPGPGGPRTSWVVHLPGTKDWQVVPGRRPHVNDLATNLELLAGEPGARLAGLQAALRVAGVRSGEPVMLVGHSQGGMLAVRAAAELRGLDVTHVVTAGSPVGRMPVPAGVEVLSLENRQDVVPRLDAAPNPSAAGHVTVAFDAPGRTLVDEHDLSRAYLPAAAALDRTDDPAVRAWLASASVFLDGRRTATRTVVRLTGDGPTAAG